MKLVAIACVRDECDIIEAFVRHTLGIASHMVVLDNGSSDGTRAILASLQKEGLPLDVIDEPTPGKYLSVRLTRLMHEHALKRFRADWVLPLDADEFVIVDGLPATLIEQASGDKPLLLQWRHYVTDETDDPREVNPALRMRHRLTEERFPAFKMMVPARVGQLPGSVIEQGNHHMTVNGRVLETESVPGARLAHFPVRHVGQFIAKTVVGYLQNEAMARRNYGWGWHYRESYHRLLEDPEAYHRDFALAARRYANPLDTSPVPETMVDPLRYRGGPLQYTKPPDQMRASWQPILRYVEDLARRYGMLSASLDEVHALSLEQQGSLFVHLCGQIAQKDHERMAQWHQIQLLEKSQQTLSQQLDQAHQEIWKMAEKLRRSWTWRAGRTLLWPARLLRGLWLHLR
jgi:glycosyltransferase involved in cell wall biosynthesis